MNQFKKGLIEKNQDLFKFKVGDQDIEEQDEIGDVLNFQYLNEI